MHRIATHQLIAVFVASITLFISAVTLVCFHRNSVVIPRLGSGGDVFLHQDINAYLPTDLPWELDDGTEDLTGQTSHVIAAWNALKLGNVEWEKRNHSNAIKQWETVATKYGECEVALAALSNIGKVIRAAGDRRAAIQAYKRLVAWPEPPTDESVWGSLYSNYKHDACIEISEMFLESQNLPSALKYANLALHTHPFSGWCGVCVASIN